MEEEEEEMIETKREFPIFRDIRRYTCAYCGIVRSKKTLITTHILQSHHQDEIKEEEGDDENGGKKNVCEECGVSFKKPAHLKQHMQSHSLERPFICPIDDCDSSYRRKDHLNRHLLQHEGKLFDCPNENCEKKFSIQGNMTRHVREIHDDVESTNADVDDRKQHACSEPGCGKVFKYVSKLQKHEESHVRLETREAFCAEPGCMKYFSNVKCLKAHLQSCHQHVTCEICGSKHLKKNIKRHLRTHENIASKDKIQCSFDGCSLTFSKSSNLQQHVKAAHFQEKPYVCSISGCGMRFSFKHVRDNHEKSGRHVYTLGDFVEGDDEFRSRPRGGVKRKLPVKIDALMRKRVCPPSECDELHGSDYISWLLSTEDED
ncbi:putative transcription factor C2H2 family [Helianthus annuus]|uniref:transcription factor IIIA n=1 Tax=Helianthus annuus TaxID=4232 RepID=UPI000B8F307C|nr:transcription factor IIIA [Helianthus annuus]KAJ0431123.1 putative transcription factor C2H2 family [Helianthus annuus]KAJ0436250.1 putative transcription factor C2H2 family [Helianthus annuus]KAJ0449571.1 putative transcription factor C2H2 family [Helianthus annuus]KAJ0828815.1 putative transcription factor C2H2 family [Helianthus annuus]